MATSSKKNCANDPTAPIAYLGIIYTIGAQPKSINDFILI